MIRHPTIEAIIDQSIGNVKTSSEDLVQVSIQLVGDSVLVDSMLKFQEVQLSVDVVDVIVKVTTTEFLSDLVDECNEDLCVDRFRMHDIVDEAMLFTDGGNHS